MVIVTDERKALESGEVHVWTVEPGVATDAAVERAWLGVLDDDERRGLDRLHSDALRRERLAGKALVRTTLSRYAGLPPQAWTFSKGPHGRPELATGQTDPPLRFNLSHTNSLCTCAVTLDREVGIDVEDLKRRGRNEGIAERYFAPSEARALAALAQGERNARFYDYWTLKESYIKARGLGLSLALQSFAFDLRDGEPVRIVFDGGEEVPSDWQFELMRPTDRHVMAVCVRRGAGPPLTLRVRPAGLPTDQTP